MTNVDRTCVIFLVGPQSSQEFISQVLSQFDTNLSADISCCVITPIQGDPPLWCGSAPSSQATGDTWAESLAGLRFPNTGAGSLDAVGVTLHNLLDDIEQYSIVHAVWITDQMPSAGASLILASGLMRFIKCHHGYLSIISKTTVDSTSSPWVKAMKAAVIPLRDVGDLARTINKACWVADLTFRGTNQQPEETLTGLIVNGKHTDIVTNGNLTSLSVIKVVSSVPLYVLKECVEFTTFRRETAIRLSRVSHWGVLCKVNYQREQGIKSKAEWIRAVQSRSVGSQPSTTLNGPYVLLWRNKLYTFRDIIQPPSTQKGGVPLISQHHSTSPTDYYSVMEQKLIEFFERGSSSAGDNSTKSFPVRIPSPRHTPAAASIPSPHDILSVYEPGCYKTSCAATGGAPSNDKRFDESYIASLSYREALQLPQTHGIYYDSNYDDKMVQELQRKYVHRETYSSVSPYNMDLGKSTPLSKETSRPTPRKPSSTGATSSGKCRANPLERSRSTGNITATSSTGLQEGRLAKSADNISTTTTTTGEPKPSRSQKNKTLLKGIISDCLREEGIAPEHARYKSLCGKTYDLCKLLLRDAVSGSDGIRAKMAQVVRPQVKIVINIDREKNLL